MFNSSDKILIEKYMIKITNNDLSALSTDKIQALDFNATWCVPCKALKPKLEAIEKDFVNIEI